MIRMLLTTCSNFSSSDTINWGHFVLTIFKGKTLVYTRRGIEKIV